MSYQNTLDNYMQECSQEMTVEQRATLLAKTVMQLVPNATATQEDWEALATQMLNRPEPTDDEDGGWDGVSVW